MKQLLTIYAILFSICVSAQNITKTNLNDEDIQCVIANLFDVQMQKYDLSSYLDKEYQFSVYIDEYSRTPTNDLSKERMCSFSMGRNYKSVNGGDKLASIDCLTIAARIDSDSTALLSFSFMPSRIGGSIPLEVITLEESNPKRPEYSSRSFKFDGRRDMTGEIPLFLYGSLYYDEKAEVMRFCGEKEIDPDMSSPILADIPHFYVIGIIVKETNKK